MKKLLVLMLLLVGCSAGGETIYPPDGRDEVITTISGEVREGNFWHGTIDGIECIAMDATYGGGISCDWSDR